MKSPEANIWLGIKSTKSFDFPSLSCIDILQTLLWFDVKLSFSINPNRQCKQIISKYNGLLHFYSPLIEQIILIIKMCMIKIIYQQLNFNQGQTAAISLTASVAVTRPLEDIKTETQPTRVTRQRCNGLKSILTAPGHYSCPFHRHSSSAISRKQRLI